MKRYIMLTGSLIAILLGGMSLYALQLGLIGSVSAQEAVEIPFLDQWSASGHADASAEAFVHWDEDDPAEIPVECAKCHSTPGHHDFLGVDGSEAGVVDAAAPLGTTIECVACHNEVSVSKDSVVMPSGAELTDLGDEARCMECHQGRESTVSVNETLTEVGVEEDTVSADITFQNIHYYAAAATKYGTLAQGGYQYEGNSYDANFVHVEGYETCIECHDSHTLEVQVEECSECHTDVTAVEDLRDIRMEGSLVDYDGDGDIEEGIYFELEGLQAMLLEGMQSYAAEVAGQPIAYETATYPYFFIDTDEDGQAGEGEADFPNRYDAWTPRLLKAAYNYQTSLKDPGAYAHGGKYIIQLLYDSIEDLNSAIAEPIDLMAAHRVDHGHFAGSEEAFRHWDMEEGEVPGRCSKCHSAEGLPLFLKDNAAITQPIANGFQCETCHNDLVEFTIYEVEEVEFPSGEIINSEDGPTNLCMNCHQGRTSKFTVDDATDGLQDDIVADTLGFLNIHYFAAGATLFGTEAKGAYEYDEKEYEGFYDHVSRFDTCTDCHSTHRLEVKVEECTECHENVETKEDLLDIRELEDDFDGDGDVEEGIAREIETMREMLYGAIQTYATDVVGTDIVYESHNYPYYFTDTNGNGEADADEAVFPNQYATWTPRLLRAAYNYQYVSKDPGTYTHNPEYTLQILYDSLEDIGQEVELPVDIETMTRP